MSTTKVSQIWETKDLDNTVLTATLVTLLKSNNLVAKEIAGDLNVPTKRVHNWFYRSTGMTALDLLRMMRQYGFIRKAVLSSLPREKKQADFQ